MGSAFVCASRTHSVRLPPESSIFTAELTAIREALKHCFDLNETTYVICCDSRSSLAIIEHLYSKHSIVVKIQDLLIQLQTAHKTVSLCWVPSHVGVRGNEHADEAARAAISNQEIVHNFHIPYKDSYPLIKKRIRERWSAEWLASEGSKLREIKDSVVEWPSSHHKVRRVEVTLCRLRIGHTLPTHRYLMERSGPPVCQHCNVLLSVKHLLVECSSTEQQRRQYYGHGAVTLTDILSDRRSFRAEKLMSYLRAIGISEV